MEQFEIPKEPLYNGEEILPFKFREDLYSKKQWLFERHYAHSEFALDIPFRERFFREGHPLLQYQFFRGEVRPPGYLEDRQAETWWNMESNHWRYYGSDLERSPFVLYFRDWSMDKAAGNEGFNMWASRVNPWLDRYLEFAPMSPYPL